MADLRHLYQDTLLEHYRAPLHAEPLRDADARATRNNPTCGDRCEAFLRFDGGRITEAAVVSKGCAIAVASGSILSELCGGLDAEAARGLLERAGALIEGASRPQEGDAPLLAALATLRDYPTRHNCALLARDALRLALASACESGR